jgi:hypothetical protein
VAWTCHVFSRSACPLTSYIATSAKRSFFTVNSDRWRRTIAIVLPSLCSHASYRISFLGHKSCPTQYDLYLSYQALGGLAPTAGPAIAAAVVLWPPAHFSGNTLHLQETPQPEEIHIMPAAKYTRATTYYSIYCDPLSPGSLYIKTVPCPTTAYRTDIWRPPSEGQVPPYNIFSASRASTDALADNDTEDNSHFYLIFISKQENNQHTQYYGHHLTQYWEDSRGSRY